MIHPGFEIQCRLYRKQEHHWLRKNYLYLHKTYCWSFRNDSKEMGINCWALSEFCFAIVVVQAQDICIQPGYQIAYWHQTTILVHHHPVIGWNVESKAYCLQRKNQIDEFTSFKISVVSGGSRISQRVAPTPEEGAPIYYFANNLLKKKLHQIKEIGSKEGHGSLAPHPLDLPMVITI